MSSPTRKFLVALLALFVAIYCWTIVSTAAGPSAQLILPSSAYVGEVVVVDARGSVGVCDKPQADGTQSIQITYGDDSDPSKPRVSELPASGHVWDRAGVFTVKVLVKDCAGASSTVSQQIEIKEIPAATGGAAISDDCLVNGTGNNVQTLVDKGTPAANGACLQAAINRAAQRGTVEQEILLPVSAIYDGEIVIPVARAGDRYITIRPINSSAMVYGRRAGATDSPNMPTIQVKTAQGFSATAITLPAGAHHFRFQGLHVRRDSPTASISRAIWFNGFGTSHANQTSNILFEWLWVDGGPMPANTNQQNIRVGIDIYGKGISVRNSTLGNYALRGTGVDTSAISLSGGEGPFGIVNTEMVAGSENFSVSGSSMAQVATITAATVTSATLSATTDMEVDQSIAFPVGGQYHPRWTSIIRSISGNTITFDRLRDGATPDIGGQAEWSSGTPSFIDFRNNYLYKLPSWRKGSPQSDGNNDYQIKNAVEMKCGRYASFYGNVIEQMWIGDQPYTGFVMFSSGSQFGCNSRAAEVRQVEAVSNYMRHMSSGSTIIGHQHTLPISATTRFITLRNNLMQNVGIAFENSSAPMAGVSLNIDFGQYASHISYIHNTHDVGAVTGNTITNFGSDGGVQDGTSVWKNNIHNQGNGLGFFSSVAAMGAASIERFLPPGNASNFDRNLIHNIGGATYPPSGIYPGGAFAALFVDYDKGDFRLAASAPGKGGATDGADVGADIAQLQAAIGADSPALSTAAIRVISGKWGDAGPQPSPTPSPSPTATPTPSPTPQPSPLPTPTPIPLPTPNPPNPVCAMSISPVTVSAWSSGKLVVSLVGLPAGSLNVTAIASTGQLTVTPRTQTISGTSAIVEFQLRSKNKSSSVIVSGPCGSQTVSINVR